MSRRIGRGGAAALLAALVVAALAAGSAQAQDRSRFFPETGTPSAGASSILGGATAAWPSRAIPLTDEMQENSRHRRPDLHRAVLRARRVRAPPGEPAAQRRAAAAAGRLRLPAEYPQGAPGQQRRAPTTRVSSPRPGTRWAASSAPTGRATAGWPSRATRSPTSSPRSASWTASPTRCSTSSARSSSYTRRTPAALRGAAQPAGHVPLPGALRHAAAARARSGAPAVGACRGRPLPALAGGQRAGHDRYLSAWTC